jgi:hypothetical protein
MFIWRYNFIRVYQEILQTIIGLSRDITSDYLEAHSDTNCIYVSWAGDDGTGDGTSALPFRTIGTAMGARDTAHDIITILDSNTYDSNMTAYTGDAFIDIDAFTLQGAAGENPSLLVDTSTQSYVCKISNGGKFINIGILSIADSNNQITAVEILEGIIKNVEINGATKDGINVPAAATTVNITNTTVHGCLNKGTIDGNGIKIQGGIVNLTRCLINGNYRSGIYCVGATAKLLNMDYCTIAENQYGLNAYSSTNATINITNSILYNNKIYDYYHNLITICTTSCVGSIYGLSNFSRIVFNPFFISSTDFRIRTVENGYNDGSYTSPVIGQSATGKDLGCYDYSRSLVSEIYTEFNTERSDTYKNSLKSHDVFLTYTDAGLPKQVKKAYINSLYLAWESMINTEVDNLKLLYESEGNIFLSVDNGVIYTEYKVDKTKDFERLLGLGIIDYTGYKNIDLNLLEI